jgi:outer membrane protein OmpA-like peptidoglycan-associated protein
MEQYPDMKIEIQGHTDDVGSAIYNMDLSIKRAKAVYEYLTKNGISSSRLTFKGFGQTDPAFPNDSEDNRSRNRRIEFKIEEI